MTGYSIAIRYNKTSEVRNYHMTGWEDSIDDSGGTVWWLTEGNFGCDCNRGLCFARAGGMSEEEINAIDSEVDENGDCVNDRFTCGDDKYTIIEAVLDDGRHIVVDIDRISKP